MGFFDLSGYNGTEVSRVVFHSPNFLVFFLILLIPYYLFKKSRILLLAAANVIFYGASGLGVLLLFLLVTLVVFAAVQLMRRKSWSWAYWTGIAVSVLNLVFFKYTVFILNTVETVTGMPIGAAPGWMVEIVLPVGISFYTFQLISYLIDVRRGETEPTRSFLHFWVYISLFPQLVAGPIMRGDELIPQLDQLQQKTVRWHEIKSGLVLVFIGVLKKVALADVLAQVANPLFAHADVLTPVESWIAAYAFGFQIYYDFSAYSDIALGLGWMLGIKLILNFDSPYVSSNPGEFWKRWHISLSRWIRDYIYIGLGGNRKGAVRTQFNMLAAMLISGLWHGAMWTFVLWGAVHGLLLIMHKWTLYLNRWEWIAAVRKSPLYRVGAVLVFFHIITWTWVFFRAQSIHQAMHMSWNMLHANWLELFANPAMVWISALFLLHLFEYAIRHYEEASSRFWHYCPAPLRGAVYLGLALLIIYFMKGETYDFIYFQF